MPADALPTRPAGGATLAPETRALLRERLHGAAGGGDHDGILAFVEQVTRQVAHPLGVPRDDGERAGRERAVAERLVAIVEDTRADHDDGGATPRAAAARAASSLAGDVPLLSACIQNLDLLPPGDGASDAIALVVMEAMGRLGGG